MYEEMNKYIVLTFFFFSFFFFFFLINLLCNQTRKVESAVMETAAFAPLPPEVRGRLSSDSSALSLLAAAAQTYSSSRLVAEESALSILQREKEEDHWKKMRRDAMSVKSCNIVSFVPFLITMIFQFFRNSIQYLRRSALIATGLLALILYLFLIGFYLVHQRKVTITHSRSPSMALRLLSIVSSATLSGDAVLASLASREFCRQY